MEGKPFFIRYLDLLIEKPIYFLWQILFCVIVAICVFFSVDREYKVMSSAQLALYYNPLLREHELLDTAEKYREVLNRKAKSEIQDNLKPKVLLDTRGGHFRLELVGDDLKEIITNSNLFWGKVVSDQNSKLLKKVELRQKLFSPETYSSIGLKPKVSLNPKLVEEVLKSTDLKASIVMRPEDYIKTKRNNIFAALNSLLLTFLVSTMVIYVLLNKKEK